MTRAFYAAVFGLTILSAGPAFAQSSDFTVRQGDFIEWSAENGQHQLQFGGRAGGKDLTKFGDIKLLLGDFTDGTLTVSTDGNQAVSKIETGPGKKLLKAKVIAKTEDLGKTFIFTCGRHPDKMVSRVFKVDAKDGDTPRTFKIKGEAGQNWVLEVQIDTTPP